MGELKLILDLVLAVVAALIGGIVAQRLGQPVLLGYLAGGVVIGPFTPGLALMAQIRLVALLASVVVVAKVAIVTVVVLLLGLPGRIAFLAGLSLAQVSEFSFVLVRIGVDAGAIPSALYSLILPTALVSILLSPTLLRSSTFFLKILERLPILGPQFAEPVVPDPASAGLREQTVICGFGRVGR